MDKIQSILDVLKIRKFFIVASIGAALSFVILYYLTLSSVADQSIAIFFEMSGFWFSLLSFLSIGAIAILFGINLALVLFGIGQFSRISGKGTIGGFAGIVSGAFASGCPMCGTFLFSLVGSPLAPVYLPFAGLELEGRSKSCLT